MLMPPRRVTLDLRMVSIALGSFSFSFSLYLVLSPPRSVALALALALAVLPAGRDGAVSLRGVTASIIGGGLIGAMGFTKRSLIAGAVLGWLGSYIDSILGAVLQTPGLSFKSGNGEINWKGWNSIGG